MPDDGWLAAYRCPGARFPGRFAIAGYIQEILTHAWALAEARGADVLFGPVVQVSPDAGPYAQLAAWLGRQP